MNLAVDKCKESGVGVVTVFNSHHFGAAGCYSRIAADRGVIGLVTSATRGVFRRRAVTRAEFLSLLQSRL